MDNPYQAPNSELHTPHNSEALKYVGFWARTLATLVDTLLMMIIIIPIAYLMLDSLDQLAVELETPGPAMMCAMYGVPVVLVLVFWKLKGSTPGKMLFNAKIVDAKTGATPSTWQYVGRYLGYILSALGLYIGFFWVGWDKRKQGWHDKVAGTVVVSPTDDPSQQISFDG